MRLGLLLHIIFLTVAVLILPGFTYAAETDTMEVLSDYDFASDTFGDDSDIAKALDQQNKDGEKANTIICGKEFCDRKTQNCMFCRSNYDGVIDEEYKCISLNDSPQNYNNSDLGAVTRCYLSNEGGTNLTQVGFTTLEHGNCMQGTDGKKYCFTKDKNKVNITYAGETYKGCEVFPVKLYKQKKCFFCPLFGVIYRAADEMASLSMDKLAPAFATLIALGLGIWIAFQTLTHVSSITKQDAPKFLGGLIKQSFKFLIAFLLLQYSTEIYSWIVNPLLQAGLKFGQELLSYKLSGTEEQDFVLAGGAFFKQDTYKNLHNFVASVQNSIAFMQAIGTSLMCIGGNLMMGSAGISMENFGSGFQMMVQGLVLAIFGFLLSLAFAFYLIDAVVQLGIVGALMPFLIACWPFKLTSQYTNKGFSMLLNSFFIFVFVGLVVSINLKLVDSALGSNQKPPVQTTENKSPKAPPAKTANEQNFGALMQIANAINEQRLKTEGDKPGLRDLTDISGVGFLILLFCCIFGFKFCGQSSALADKMAGGGMKAIAPGIATMGASAAISAGKKVSQPAREAVADKATELTGNGMRKLGAAITGRGRRHGQKADDSSGDKGGSRGSESATQGTAGGTNGGGSSGSNGGGDRGTSGGAQSSKNLGQADSPSKPAAPQTAGGQGKSGSKPTPANGTLSSEERSRQAKHNLEKTQELPQPPEGRNRSQGGSRKNNNKISSLADKN